MNQAAALFEPQRRRLLGLAYRMLGSRAEAEDVVQDAFLRWCELDVAQVDSARAYLARIVTTLCLDRLKSARAQREHYVGAWLPEPVVDEQLTTEDEAGLYAHDLSVALMLALERLSPLERAAFLLHDVFDMEFDAVGKALERAPAAVRQLASRARERVREAHVSPRAPREVEERIVRGVRDAMAHGDVTALTALLAEDVTLVSDGGGKRPAAFNPLRGRDVLIRFFKGLSKKARLPAPPQIVLAEVNGRPGIVIHEDDGVTTYAFEFVGEQISALFVVRNPDKLRHVSRLPPSE